MAIFVLFWAFLNTGTSKLKLNINYFMATHRTLDILMKSLNDLGIVDFIIKDLVLATKVSNLQKFKNIHLFLRPRSRQAAVILKMSDVGALPSVSSSYTKTECHILRPGD